MVLGHILKNAGHQVEVYEELNEDVDFSQCMDADVIGIYTMTSCAPRAYNIADMFRQHNCRVILGGMHASAVPEEAIKHADQVIVGEAESVIKDVVEKKITDKIIKAPIIYNLDEIPFPDYSLLKTSCSAANVITTRGCPFSCSFCTTSRMFHPYRERSVENVIEELRYYKSLGFKCMNFEDDNFTANKKRTKKLLRRMIEENLVFKETFFFGRTDLAEDEELLQLLQKAHLNRVLVGIESLNQKSLNAINKKQKIVDIEKCAKRLAQYKIRLIASLVLGLDDDSIEDIRRGVKFCRHINAYQLQPAVLTPFPGTPVYKKFIKEKRMITDNWRYFDMMNVTFKPRNMSAWQLQKEFFHSVRKFYNFTSSFKIMRLFGFDSGIRRLGLWFISRIGIAFSYFYIWFGKHNYYTNLKKFCSNNKTLTE
nr:radical SAM protein [Pectinatus sottacetonis]